MAIQISFYVISLHLFINYLLNVKILNINLSNQNLLILLFLLLLIYIHIIFLIYYSSILSFPNQMHSLNFFGFFKILNHIDVLLHQNIYSPSKLSLIIVIESKLHHLIIYVYHFLFVLLFIILKSMLIHTYYVINLILLFPLYLKMIIQLSL